MNEIMGGNDSKTDREIFERGEMQELAYYLVDLHMDMFRREKILDDFKKFLWCRYTLQAPVLVAEIERAVREYNYELND